MTPGDRLAGCLVGTALGDSLLLPMEGLPGAVALRRFPGPLRQRLVGGWGMVSDDTEHAFLTAQALTVAGGDAECFARRLAWALRWWLVALPAGCGRATALGLVRSWCGVPPQRSGVRSAGNGPAMRAAVIGVRWCRDAARRRAFTAAAAAITHRDPVALAAALAVAETAAALARGEDADWPALWAGDGACPDWTRAIAAVAEADGPAAAAAALGCAGHAGGWSLHSVPVALVAWRRHRDDPAACFAAIQAVGGDSDTMGAIAGALLGTGLGGAAFPADWRDRLIGWPMGLDRLHAVAAALAGPDPRPVPWAWWAQPARNLAFLMVVLAHGLRRLLPG
jgi:ADP-ribosylglycohydrolase